MRRLGLGLAVFGMLATFVVLVRGETTQGMGRDFGNRDLEGDYVFALTLAACTEPTVGTGCPSTYCRYSGQLDFDGIDTVKLSQLVFCTGDVPSRTFSSHHYVVDEDGTFQIEGWFQGQILERRGALVLRSTVNVGGEAFLFYGVATAG